MNSRDFLQNNSSELTAQLLADAITGHQSGRFTEAEKLYRNILELAPDNVDTLRLLGLLYLQTEKPMQALLSLEAALKIHSQNPETLAYLGVALATVGQAENAVTRFHQALEINPKDVDTLNNLGKIYFEKGDLKGALDCYVKSIQIRPNDPKTFFELGKCYYETADFQKAIVCFERLLHQFPDKTDVLGGLAASYWAVERRKEAYTLLERALSLDPSAKATLNLGEFLYDEGKITEALALYNQALSLAPDYQSALWRKSYALLALGEYREGWKLYANSFGQRETRGPSLFAPNQAWDGTPLPNKHLLIWGEQGLGDVLQFIRYAELCKKHVGKITVFCHKSLVRLFKALPFIDNATDIITDKDQFDAHISIMNLPFLFKTTLETVPANIPYLHVDSEIQSKWNARFVKSTRLKVGLVWAGGSHSHNIRSYLKDKQRSIGLELIKPWFELPNIQYYSLQKGAPAEQIVTLNLSNRIIDFTREIEDFSDTAAIIQNLDLIITVDTSVAHLAGGLGKPVWIMSRYNADWRWLQNSQINPWYPSARIFGQSQLGEWNQVVLDVKRELELEIAKRVVK